MAAQPVSQLDGGVELLIEDGLLWSGPHVETAVEEKLDRGLEELEPPGAISVLFVRESQGLPGVLVEAVDGLGEGGSW
jgi:hypothetical protein